ncbi:hypothetical protein P1P68_03265 [Streptomyces scabiei]|uniref:hypothetical protein n=1 Tax=Streptomyces scabiei TaxID=1930 RepID=UPI0029907C98|nr:hypothetical protein [Streptomyces scabiei]MDW8803837.1 hypothetical protein [Streptomyces scabiei]
MKPQEEVGSLPEVSCLVGAWLAGVKDPVRAVLCEVLALAQDGYLEVCKHKDGYSLHWGRPEFPELPRDRGTLLGAILGQYGAVRLYQRTDAPPTARAAPLISLARIRDGVTRTALQRGLINRKRLLKLAVAFGTVVAGVLVWQGAYSEAGLMGMGSALLGTWVVRETNISRAGGAEQNRVLALRDRLRQDAARAAADRDPVPSPGHNPTVAWEDVPDHLLLPWAALLLTDTEFEAWFTVRFTHASPPRWWIPDAKGDPAHLDSPVELTGLMQMLLTEVGP